MTGYPPDLLHDLFEGIVPRELALCLQVFIKSKYFTLDELNKNIKTFPYKWSDKTNAPQQVPLNFGILEVNKSPEQKDSNRVFSFVTFI